jgi:6-phosphogluconolactonase (cycloisomerase 2 family)
MLTKRLATKSTKAYGPFWLDWIRTLFRAEEEPLMRSASKSLVALLSTIILMMALCLAGCGPTNGLPALTGEYVYVSNQADGTISEYSINTSTGLLTNDAIIVPIPPSSTSGPYPDGAYPAISGSGLQLMALHSSNEFLYVPDSTANNIVAAYTADGGYSGQLFAPSFAPASAGTSPFDVAFDHGNNYLYATNASGVDEFSIDLHSGQLTSIGSVAVSTPLGLAASQPSCDAGEIGLVAVATGAPNPGVTVLDEVLPEGTLTSSSLGALVPVGPANTKGTPELDLFNPKNSNQVFITDDADGVVQIVTYTETGAHMGGEPFCDVVPVTVRVSNSVSYVSAEGYPYGITADPAGNYLYTANPKSNSISIFPITSTGLSTPTVFTGSTIASSEESIFDCPISIAIEKTGQYAYVANNCNGTISELAIDSTTGALTSIGSINTENPANPGSNCQMLWIGRSRSGGLPWLTIG